MERSGSFRASRHSDIEHLTSAPDQVGADFVRKRSLVRPERQRFDANHPQYHYQQVAQQQSDHIHVLPSTTGNEPMIPTSPSAPAGMSSGTGGPGGWEPVMDAADEEDSFEEFGRPRYGELRPPGPSGPTGSASMPANLSHHAESGQPGAGEYSPPAFTDSENPSYESGGPTEPYYGGGIPPSGHEDLGLDDLEHSPSHEPRPAPYMPKEGGISLWEWYCRLITFPIVPAMMRPFGMRTAERQMAWREKIGLISVILMVGAFVGYLTFGFQQTVCTNSGTRIHQGKVPSDNMIISGAVYDFGSYDHPGVEGIEANSPILYPPVNAGGKDGSFLFQNVNGHCKGIIKPKAGTKIPNNDKGEMGWYFPCQLIHPNNDSLVPNSELVNNASNVDFYNGWACHTGANARNTLYEKGNKTAVVYYTWDDVQKSSKRLVVFNGDVLDIGYIDYLLKDDVDYPPLFDLLRHDAILRGQDVSQQFSYGQDRQIIQCLREITKVGEIDTDTIGCIASDVVLYVSLVFIMGLVIVKFVLACYFRFVIARKQGAYEMSSREFNERERRIEEWGDDEYSPANRFQETPARHRERPKSMFVEKITAPHVEKTTKVTMGTQNRSGGMSRVNPGGSVLNASLYRFSRPSTVQLNDYGTGSGSHSGTGSGSGILSTVDTAYHGLEPEAIGLKDLTPPPVPSDRSGSFSSHSGKSAPGSARGSLRDGNSLPGSPNMSEVAGPVGPIGGTTEYIVPQPPVDYQPWGYPLAHVMCMITAYSESVEGLRTTLDSVCTTEYPNSHKLVFIVCDGLVKGSGNDMSTPDICLSMMTDFSMPPEEVEAHSYVSVVTGAKRHNMAKVYAGFYKYDDDTVPPEKQQRTPMMLVVKTGTPAEAGAAKPGNRGKRDSQIILMSFLQRVMFDERMTELEYEIFNGIVSVAGIAPDFYEMLLMVDADTKVYPDCLTHMCAEMIRDPEIMGLCGETKIANKMQSWVTMIQVFEYFISHHQAKAFESVFGGVTCLPGCFSIYRIKSPKGAEGFWVPILCNPDIVERYSDNVIDTLHKKNLLLLGEDRFLSTLMLKTFPKRQMMFLPKAACKTVVPDEFKVLLSQRRRWINSTIHNLMELVLVRDLCGVFVVSMQFVVFIDLVSTLVLPAAISFTTYVVVFAIVGHPKPIVSLVLLALILGLPGVLIVVTATRASYVLWMLVYLMALPIWNFVLPMNAYWRFDDFSWGDTRAIEGGDKGGHDEASGEFDSSQIVMKRWREFQRDRERSAALAAANAPSPPPTMHY